MSLKVSDQFIKQGNGYIWNMGLCYLFLGSRNIRNTFISILRNTSGSLPKRASHFLLHQITKKYIIGILCNENLNSFERI